MRVSGTLIKQYHAEIFRFQGCIGKFGASIIVSSSNSAAKVIVGYLFRFYLRSYCDIDNSSPNISHKQQWHHGRRYREAELAVSWAIKSVPFILFHRFEWWFSIGPNYWCVCPCYLYPHPCGYMSHRLHLHCSMQEVQRVQSFLPAVQCDCRSGVCSGLCCCTTQHGRSTPTQQLETEEVTQVIPLSTKAICTNKIVHIEHQHSGARSILKIFWPRGLGCCVHASPVFV